MTVITTNEAANTSPWPLAPMPPAGLGGTIAVQNAGDVTNVILTLADAEPLIRGG